MNKPSLYHNHMQLRSGFSLVELLIVMAVLAAVAGLVLPSLRGPLDKSRLTGAAKELRASLAKARALAIRESRQVAFRYEIGGDRYIIERASGPANAMITVLEDSSGATTTPSGLTTESADAPTARTDNPDGSSLKSMTLREGRLPVGLSFAEPVSEKEVSDESQIAPDVIAPAITTSDPSTGGFRRWSDAIRFEPSGRTQDAVIRVTGQRDFVVDVTLRGLTATAMYSAPTRITPPQAPTSGNIDEALP